MENGAGKLEPKVGKFREILPQIIASTVKNFLLLDLGLAVAFPVSQVDDCIDESHDQGLCCIKIVKTARDESTYFTLRSLCTPRRLLFRLSGD